MNNNNTLDRGYEDRLILFVDILGFTSDVRRATNYIDKFLCIKNTLEEIESMFRSSYDGTSLEFSQFSDSLVISFPANYPGGVYYIITQASFAIHLLFSNGYSCKGVISIGPLFHKGNLLFGPEFLNVMKKEALDNMPRITVHREILEIAKICPGEGNIGYPDKELYYIFGHLEQINSNFFEIAWFKNYASLVGGGNNHTHEHYEKINNLIKKNLNEYKTIRVLKKYLYLKRQFEKAEGKGKIIYKRNFLKYLSLLPIHVCEEIKNFFLVVYWKMK